MEISQMLKEKRKEHQLTQEQLAQKIFVTNKTISNWETKKTTPDIDSLIRLAKIFDLSLDNLLLEGSDVVKDIKRKEQAYNIQKSFILGAQLTNILLFLFLFLPSMSPYFYVSDSMYFPLLAIICSNGYTFILLQREVNRLKGSHLETHKLKKVGILYMIIAFIICVIVISRNYLF